MDSEEEEVLSVTLLGDSETGRSDVQEQSQKGDDDTTASYDSVQSPSSELPRLTSTHRPASSRRGRGGFARTDVSLLRRQGTDEQTSDDPNPEGEISCSDGVQEQRARRLTPPLSEVLDSLSPQVRHHLQEIFPNLPLSPERQQRKNQTQTSQSKRKLHLRMPNDDEVNQQKQQHSVPSTEKRAEAEQGHSKNKKDQNTFATSAKDIKEQSRGFENVANMLGDLFLGFNPAPGIGGPDWEWHQASVTEKDVKREERLSRMSQFAQIVKDTGGYNFDSGSTLLLEFTIPLGVRASLESQAAPLGITVTRWGGEHMDRQAAALYQMISHPTQHRNAQSFNIIRGGGTTPNTSNTTTSTGSDGGSGSDSSSGDDTSADDDDSISGRGRNSNANSNHANNNRGASRSRFPHNPPTFDGPSRAQQEQEFEAAQIAANWAMANRLDAYYQRCERVRRVRRMIEVNGAERGESQARIKEQLARIRSPSPPDELEVKLKRREKKKQREKERAEAKLAAEKTESRSKGKKPEAAASPDPKGKGKGPALEMEVDDATENRPDKASGSTGSGASSETPSNHPVTSEQQQHGWNREQEFDAMVIDEKSEQETRKRRRSI